VPELPDVTIYVEALRARAAGRVLERIRIASPFLLRTVEPSIESAEGHRVTDIRRLGKRVVLALEGDLFLVIHLMIAGRLLWKPPGQRPRSRIELAAFDFGEGMLILTEAGTTRRA
jgi:formamidopyrimidine-DNA glycosylase